MLDISFLRLSGIALGSISVFIALLRFRSHAKKRGLVWSLLLFGTILTTIGVFPSVVDFPTELLLLREQKGGRLLTLLILSNVCLWFISIYQRSKTEKILFQLDSFVRNHSLLFFNKDGLKDVGKSVVILMPAYNEAKNLIEILPSIPKSVKGMPVNLIVIDDGSVDETSKIAEKSGATVAQLMVNRGGGAALKVGYDIIKKIQPEVVVTMDADGQHNPQEIENLVLPIMQGKADLVIGSRILGCCENYSRLRMAGVHTFSRLINFIVGTKITDCSSGFRAIKGTVIQESLLLQEQYHTAELIIEAAKRGFIITERPVTISRRLSGFSKKGSNLKYAFLFLRTILKTWLR